MDIPSDSSTSTHSVSCDVDDSERVLIDDLKVVITAEAKEESEVIED